MTAPTQDLIDRLAVAAADAREAVVEAHQARRDLTQARKETQEEYRRQSEHLEAVIDEINGRFVATVRNLESLAESAATPMQAMLEGRIEQWTASVKEKLEAIDVTAKHRLDALGAACDMLAEQQRFVVDYSTLTPGQQDVLNDAMADRMRRQRSVTKSGRTKTRKSKR